MKHAKAWGRLPGVGEARQRPWGDRHAALPTEAGPRIAHGLGRSYGDVALNPGGELLMTRGLDRFIHFDRAQGVLRAEAGVSLDEVLALVMPAGWFVAVTPGSRYVSLGGCVANDVHGKNHARAGSFGHHVRAFELLRSDGSRRVCRPGDADGRFEATVGGLGLTGLITWVEIQLIPIRRPWMAVVQRRFASLDAYWDLDESLAAHHDYTVAWVDCLRGGRGLYSAADFAGHDAPQAEPGPGRRRVPLEPPISLVNGLSVSAFNLAYYHLPRPAFSLQPALKYFYPLDGLADWNRIYGRRGFYQYQCVLPRPAMKEASRALFDRIGRAGSGSFLAVFKTFGERPPAGLLSFPRAGATLALDFPNQGAASHRLLAELDAVVREAGGALYPAKDARMSADMFRAGYPALDAFRAHVDPAFSSGFWRRVADEAPSFPQPA